MPIPQDSELPLFPASGQLCDKARCSALARTRRLRQARGSILSAVHCRPPSRICPAWRGLWAANAPYVWSCQVKRSSCQGWVGTAYQA